MAADKTYNVIKSNTATGGRTVEIAKRCGKPIIFYSAADADAYAYRRNEREGRHYGNVKWTRRSVR